MEQASYEQIGQNLDAEDVRVLGRQVAHELTDEEIMEVSGGGTSYVCSGCSCWAADCCKD